MQKFGCKIQRAQKLEMFAHRLLSYAEIFFYRSRTDDLLALTVTYDLQYSDFFVCYSAQ